MPAFLPHGEGRRPGEAAQLPPHAVPLDRVAGLPHGKLQAHRGSRRGRAPGRGGVTRPPINHLRGSLWDAGQEGKQEGRKPGRCSKRQDRALGRRRATCVRAALSSVTHGPLFRPWDDPTLAPPGPPSPGSEAVTRISPRRGGRSPGCSWVKPSLPAARGQSQVNPGPAGPASRPHPAAPRSGPPRLLSQRHPGCFEQ